MLQDEDRSSSAEQYVIEESPFADILKDQASSSGSSNPPENKATGNLFGQSPAPDLLLLRKSTGKSKPALLPSFSEVACFPFCEPGRCRQVSAYVLHYAKHFLIICELPGIANADLDEIICFAN